MKTALTSCAAACLLTTGPCPAADPDSAISASDAEALRAKAGQVVLVKGSVREIEVQEGSGDRLMWFNDSELMGLLRSKTYGSGRTWVNLRGLTAKLDKPRKPIFIGGEIVEYKGKLELLLHSSRQINEDAKKIDLEDIPLVKTLTATRYAIRNTAEPVREGALVPYSVPPARLEFKSQSASVRIARYDREELLKSPDAEPKLLTVTAKVEDAPGIGPAQLVVEPAVRRPPDALQGLGRSMPPKLHGWPWDCLVVFSIEGNGEMSGLAAAVLIEAMLTGREVPKQFVLAGDLNLSLEVETRDFPLKGSFLREWAAATFDSEKVPLRVVRGPAKNPHVFEELRFGRMGDAVAIHNCQVIGCENLDEVLKVTGIADAEGLAETLTRFDQTQKVVLSKGEPILKHPKVAERVAEALAALPHHISAGHYASVASGEVTRYRSKESSGRILGQLWYRIVNVRNGADNRTISKNINERQRELDAMGNELHPEIMDIRDEIDDYFKAISPIHRKSLETDTLLTQREVDLMRTLDLKRNEIDQKLRSYRR